MPKKVKTMKLSGNDYAKVNDRILQFREENPRGLIVTEPTITPEYILFKARILKDKKDPNSAEATGHSMGKGTAQKIFEKQESIAVGRALALLGYAPDGEIASYEEMEEFEEWKQEQFMERLTEAAEQIDAAKSLDELKEVWVKLDANLQVALFKKKEDKKSALSAKVKKTPKHEKNKDGSEHGGVASVAEDQDLGLPA